MPGRAQTAKERARTLHDKGVSYADIGELLGIGATTARTWVTGTPERRSHWDDHSPHCTKEAPHRGPCVIELWSCHCPPSHRDPRPIWDGKAFQCEWCKLPVFDRTG